MDNVVDKAVGSKSAMLSYKVKRFEQDGWGRCVLINNKTLEFSVSASIFEAAYAIGIKRRTSTIYTIFHHVAYLFTWGDVNGINLDDVFLSGLGLDFASIRKFSNWLDSVLVDPLRVGSVNNYSSNVLQSCGIFSVWFVQNYTPLSGSQIGANFNYIELIRSHRECWHGVMVDSKPESIAPDLSIEELNLVENFFRTRLDSEQGDQGYHLRNYILWRLILAFGLRIGEALSLRVQDFNLTGADPCCNIVRVDERGQKYTDPRSPYSPLVKTCSRLLYFDCLDFDLIDLIECYVSRFRIARKGSNTIIFLDHDFLFVSHGAAPGRAMSSAAASKIARAVSQKCLPKFHWHLVRHAVFNRLYRAADMLEHNATEIDHIVYMGGWRNPASLRHYVKRAIRDKSRERLIARNNEVLLR